MTNYLNQICPVCGGQILLTEHGQMCEQCHYILPTPLSIKGYTGTAVGKPELSPNTIYIGKCAELIVNVNGIVIKADLGAADLSKYEAIEINGYRFENTTMKKKASYSPQCLNCATYASSNGSECSCKLGHINDVEVSP